MWINMQRQREFLWAFLVQKQLFYTRGMDALVFLCGHGRLRGHSASLRCVAAPHTGSQKQPRMPFRSHLGQAVVLLWSVPPAKIRASRGDRRVWWATVHRVTKCGPWVSDQHTSNEDQHCLSSLITSEAGVRGYRSLQFLSRLLNNRC